MKHLAICFLGLLFVGCGTRIEYFSLQGALKDPRAKEVLGSDVKLSFGINEDKDGIPVKTVRRTLAKSDPESDCRWAFYASIKQLQSLARKNGGKEIVNIVGNWKGHVYDSDKEFQCAISPVQVGVALRGKIVK